MPEIFSLIDSHPYSSFMSVGFLRRILRQLDIEHQKRIGKKLLVGFHARTPDETFGSRVADVGRYRPDGLLRVCVWRRDCALGGVFAFPVVVPANLEI